MSIQNQLFSEHRQHTMSGISITLEALLSKFLQLLKRSIFPSGGHKQSQKLRIIKKMILLDTRFQAIIWANDSAGNAPNGYN